MQYKFLTYTAIFLGLALIISALSAFNLKLHEKKLLSRISDLERKASELSEYDSRDKQGSSWLNRKTLIEKKETQAVMENEELNRKIKELNLALKEKDRKLEGLKKQMDAGTAKSEDKTKAEKSMNPLEQMKRNEPEKYEQMRQRMDEMSRKMENTLAAQQSFIAGLDSSEMSERELENHQKLKELLKSVNDKVAKANQNPDSPESEQLRRDAFNSMRDVHDMLEIERKAALNGLARSLGYGNAEDISSFSDYINYIYNMTTVRPLNIDDKGPRRGE